MSCKEFHTAHKDDKEVFLKVFDKEKYSQLGQRNDAGISQ